MQPKRSKLFPIGNTFSSVDDGRLKEVFQSSPQALHHFTRFDQVDQLVAASEADPDLGFMVRLLALCSLPRTNPGNRKEYKRVNGPYTLYMIAGGGNKLPFWQSTAPVARLGVYRSRAHPKPGTRVGSLAVRVHATAEHSQQ